MKECILEVSFEGQGWSSRLYIILFILTLELRYPQKTGVNRKTGGNFVSSSAWEGGKSFNLGKEGFARETRVRGKLQAQL